jgi:hypothetical protein
MAVFRILLLNDMLPEQVACRQRQDVVLVDETRRQCPLGVARAVSQVNKSITRM